MPASLRSGRLAELRLPAVFFAGLGVLSAVYLAAPDSWGGIAFFGTAVVGLVSLAVGPLVHRPLNRGPWYWITAAGALFLTSLLFRLELFSAAGVLGDADLWAFAGYACTARFLGALLRRTQSGRDPTLWLDTAAITTGSALVGWVMNVAPQLTRPHPHLGSTVVNTMYPVMDALLLTLTVQLGFRRGSRAPALRAALTGMTALLIGDLTYTFIWVNHPDAVNPYVNVFYMIAYGSLGLMAGHPSMRELSDDDTVHTPVTSRLRLILILLALLTPASIPIMLPTHGILDATVRALIMSVFAGVAFLRLLRTIQALQRSEATASHRATHDGLTALPNRVAFQEDLDNHLARVREQDEGTWVNAFLVGCDHFQQINDTWGHTAGDQALIEVADRLRPLVREGAFLARAGGDQFLLRVETIDPDQLSAITDQIRAAFLRPLQISRDRTAQLTVSIGIAQSGHHDHDTAQDLIRNADQAYGQARAEGPGTSAVHDASMHTAILRRHRLADALRGAVDRHEMHVAYQPIRTGPGYAQLSGWEALARWDHPELGPISPVEFISIAEDTGHILQIGAFVLQEACAQLRQWQDHFRRPDLHMSVNVSSVQLMRDDVPCLVSQALHANDLTPGDLWLEITESVVIERTQDAITILNTLTDLGITLSMDDFGTGYSSLSYLKDFNVNILKIDRSFVTNVATDPRDRELAKAMIAVAAALGLDGVVAEGVETPAQADVLAALGCSHAQGYLYGKPAAPQQARAEAEAHLATATTGATRTPAPVPNPRHSQTSHQGRIEST